jgi:hypothetical protein
MPPRPKLAERAPTARKPDDTPDEETLAFEEAVLRDVVGSVGDALAAVIRAVLAAFEGASIAAGGTLSEEQAKAVGKAAGARIRREEWYPMRPALAASAVAAHALGVERAARRMPNETAKAKARSTKTPKKRPVPNVDAQLRKALREAETLARQGIRNRTEAAQVVAKVSKGKARVEAAARSIANEGINAGTIDVAKKMQLRVMWIAERNACLDCLAHAGYVAEPGDPFPPVSFDPNAKKVAAVALCPLHPNCRCQLRTTDLPAGPPPSDRSSLSPAARLAAEARRSVVYQWTEYESGPAMQRAAEALLSAGAGLPASVEQRARRMLRAKKRGG